MYTAYIHFIYTEYVAYKLNIWYCRFLLIHAFCWQHHLFVRIMNQRSHTGSQFMHGTVRQKLDNFWPWFPVHRPWKRVVRFLTCSAGSQQGFPCSLLNHTVRIPPAATQCKLAQVSKSSYHIPAYSVLHTQPFCNHIHARVYILKAQ